MARWTASAKWAAGPALDGRRGLPLALRLSEGLGVAARGMAWVWWIAPPCPSNKGAKDGVDQRKGPHGAFVVEQPLNPVLDEAALVANLAGQLSQI